MSLRADDAVGLELFFGNDVHVGHLADAELFGQAIVVEAGAAGQDLDALALQRLQISSEAEPSQVTAAPAL